MSDQQPITPPDLDEVRRLLRDRIGDLPTVMAEWARHEGPLANIPLLDPGMLAPKVFDQIAGTVRVAHTSADLITLGGLLELPVGGLLATAVAVSPADLSMPPKVEESRMALAQAGAASVEVQVEVCALISPLDEDGTGPVAGVGVVRPLVFADPSRFPHPEDTAIYGDPVHEAARAAVADDTEMVSDLGGRPLQPMPADLARIWGQLFAVARAATVGLAARGAGLSDDG